MSSIRRIVAGFAVAALLAGAPAPAQTGDAEVLLKAAMHKETVDGDLKAAIEQYRKIVARPGVSRSVAAKAQYHIGLCYEKLGDQEARKAFERVLSAYADQADIVAQARGRLAAMRGAVIQRPTSLTVRRIEPDTGASGAWGPPSADGRYIAYADWRTGNLAIRDLVSGETRLITNKRPWGESDEMAEGTAISPDGKQIAYAWLNDKRSYELRVTAVEKDSPRILCSDPSISYVMPFEWSSDSQSIIAWLSKRDLSNELWLVSTRDGSHRVLASLGTQTPGRASLSADNRYLAYDLTKAGAEQRDVFLLNMENLAVSRLSQDWGSARVLGWLPNGSGLLLRSDRSGTNDAWFQPLRNGREAGSPVLVKKDAGALFPCGFARNGSFLYWVRTAANQVYVAPLPRQASGAPISAVPVAQRFFGSNVGAAWSPDGKQVAYISQRPDSAYVVTRKMADDAERDLRAHFAPFWSLDWSPDGGMLLFAAVALDTHLHAIRALDPLTGKIEVLVQGAPGDNFAFPRWLPDGNSVVYITRRDDEQQNRIVVRNLKGGNESVLARVAGGAGSVPAPSPDGKWVAYWNRQPREKEEVLSIVPTTGGESRALLRTDRRAPTHIAWTADSSSLVYGLGVCNNCPRRDTELWSVSVGSGEPQMLGTFPASVRVIRIHPDGKQMAFDVRNFKFEFWAMENIAAVLPQADEK